MRYLDTILALAHARAHTLLSATDHTDVATYLNQALLMSSTPHFNFIKCYGDDTHYWDLGYISSNNFVIQPEQAGLGNILIKDNSAVTSITLEPYTGNAIFIGDITDRSETVLGGVATSYLAQIKLTGGGNSWYTLAYNMANELFEIKWYGTQLFSLDHTGNAIFSGQITGYYMSGDYGVTWASISLPSGVNGMQLTAYNSNTLILSSRLYIYSNSGWHFVQLT